MMRRAPILVFAFLLTAPFGAAAEIPMPRFDFPAQGDIARRLSEKIAETKALETKATEITKSLGELAAAGKIPTSADAIELMRKMVEDMAAIRQKIDAVEAEVTEIKAWIASRKDSKTPPPAGQNPEWLTKTRPFGFIQTQFRDTNQKGGANDAFSVRRMRVGLTHQLDPYASLKVSYDVATGTNNQATLLKDAMATYDLDPTKKKIDFQASMGQFSIPIGNDIARADTDREFPERALYNQRLFNGERSQGIHLRYGLGEGWSAQLGGWNALSVQDPEQASSSPGQGSRLAMTGGLRFRDAHLDAGVSGFFGERPKFVTGSGSSAVTHSAGDRQFVYLDAAYSGFLVPQAFVRGEAMWGKDRLPVTGSPTSPAERNDMRGFQVHVGYNFSNMHQAILKLEQFDPNTDSAGNALQGYGMAWNYFPFPNARITASHEIVEDPSRAGIGIRQQRYHITTLRVQFKF